jgi:hypothetical protein
MRDERFCGKTSYLVVDLRWLKKKINKIFIVQREFDKFGWAFCSLKKWISGK